MPPITIVDSIFLGLLGFIVLFFLCGVMVVIEEHHKRRTERLENERAQRIHDASKVQPQSKSYQDVLA